MLLYVAASLRGWNVHTQHLHVYVVSPILSYLATSFLARRLRPGRKDLTFSPHHNGQETLGAKQKSIVRMPLWASSAEPGGMNMPREERVVKHAINVELRG